MKLWNKKHILFSSLSLLLLGGCGSQPRSATINVTLGIPAPQSSSSSSTRSATTFASYAPIEIYLKINDGFNEVYNGIVPIGNCNGDCTSTSSTYTITPTISLSGISEKATSLTITGHYVAQGIKTGGNVCDNKSSSDTNNQFNNDNDNNDVFFADFDVSPEVRAITSDATQTMEIRPKLKNITFDKFGFKFTNLTNNYTESKTIDSSENILTTFTKTTTDMPKLTVVTLVDNNSGLVIPDPCTGRPFSARTDSQGHIATNLPIKFSDTAYLNLQASQFSLEATDCAIHDATSITCTPAELSAAHTAALLAGKSTSFTYDLVAAAKKNTISMTCSNTTYPNGTPPITTPVNTSTGIPIFWNLALSKNNNITALDPNSSDKTFFSASEVMDGSTTVCERIANNFNPRFADFPISPTNTQAYLQPIDPLGPTQPYYLTSQFQRFIDLADTKKNRDLLLVDYKNVNSYLSNLTNPNNVTVNSKNDNSITTEQKLKIKCSIVYYDDFSNPQNPETFGKYVTILPKGIAPVSTNDVENIQYEDCTQFGYNYGKINGIAQYFEAIGMPPDQDNYITVFFYYIDSEGFLIYNKSSIFKSVSSTTPISIVNPMTIPFAYGVQPG